MRFQSIRRFLGGDVGDYLKNVLAGSIEDLINGLSKLTFQDNFLQYSTEVTLSAGETKAVEHHLGVLPAGRIIFECVGGIVQDAPETASQKNDDKFWYLQNVSSTSSSTATVMFFR